MVSKKGGQGSFKKISGIAWGGPKVESRRFPFYGERVGAGGQSYGKPWGKPCERGCEPQAYGISPWNAALKDKLENRLHKEMCAGRFALEEARDMLVNDWRKACIKY